MTLARLALSNFRSYADAVLTPGAGFVILIGENGAGKTNVLEAVSLLAPGRGLRGGALGEMARRGAAGGFAISARAGGDELGTGTMAAAPERRQVRVNGAPASAQSLAERLALIWLTPAQDRLFTDSAGSRRRYLDRLVLALHPEHGHDATRYEAAMRQRNRLLAAGSRDEAWFTALEAAMDDHGRALTLRRHAVVHALNDRLLAAAEGPFARAELSLVEDDDRPLAPRLAEGRARDAVAGRTLNGPHRHDFRAMHVEKQIDAAACSTGEQKALLIAIVLAHAELIGARGGPAPMLLLDEVAAHLDGRRRAALFELLAARGGQVWMTGTEASPFEAIGEASRYEVVDGQILPLG